MKRFVSLMICLVLVLASQGCTSARESEDNELGITLPSPSSPRFSTASLYIYPDRAVFNGRGSGIYLLDFCTPGNTTGGVQGLMTIELNGLVAGNCRRDTSDGINQNGTLQGSYKSEEIEFESTLNRTFGGVVAGNNSKLFLQGRAKVTGSSASGSATFTFDCDAFGQTGECDAGQVKSLRFTGTIPFLIELR